MHSFACANSGMAVLLARLSTLYGTGQSLGKPHGLLTHIARRVIRNQPLQIYVSFDTIRDYIAFDHAAALMVAALREASEHPQALTRIIASERAHNRRDHRNVQENRTPRPKDNREREQAERHLSSPCAFPVCSSAG